MNLLVDVGNTRIKWLMAGPHWLTPASAGRSESGRSAGGVLPHAPDLMSQLEAAWSALAPPLRVVVANVAGRAVQEALQSWIRRNWPATRLHIAVASAAQLGVTNHYGEPERLGSDRWVAMIGARQRIMGPVCVVDGGTAITLDALDATGRFLGGVILPGIDLARTALTARAPGIALADGDASTCFARSTADGVAAGTLFGAAGAVERIAMEFGIRLGKDMRVLLTGGDGPRLHPLLHTRLAYEVEEVPDLVLQGLGHIAASLT